jgi:hypothetical protein
MFRVKVEYVFIRFGGFTVVIVKILVFWAVTPCSLADEYRHFGSVILPPSAELKCAGLGFSPTSSLKREAEYSSENFICAYKTTWCHKPEAHNINVYIG